MRKMQSFTRFASSATPVYGALVVATLLSIGMPHAHAQSQRELYIHAQVSGGYWHYWQSAYADRELDGGVLSAHGAFALWLSDEIALGTAISLDFYYGSGRSFTTDHVYENQAAPGGSWGLLFVWTPSGEQPPVSLEVSAGIGGGGNPHWGGGGPFVSPALTVFLFHHERSHLGLTFRAEYAELFSDDATPRGAQKHLLIGSAAIGWTFF